MSFHRGVKMLKLVGSFITVTMATVALSTPLVKTPDGALHGTGLLRKTAVRHGALYWSPTTRPGAPLTLDIRQLGQVAPVRDQLSCGSCWAFSTTKSLESARLRMGLPTLDLAEQDMVSCDTAAFGCSGGTMDDMDYVVKKGLPLESNYKYTATNSRCKRPEPAAAAKGVRWGYCGAPGREPTTAEIKQCLTDYGVLSVTVAAGGNDWARGGRMTDCSVTGVNHMVNLVGYEADGTLIGRNSWGTSWGDKGDFYARQGCDELATGPDSVSFVVVSGAPGPHIPHITLPAEVTMHPGTELALGRHQAENGVQYAWTADGVALPDTASMIYVTPTKSTVYAVKASTVDGTAQSSVQVNVLSSLEE